MVEVFRSHDLMMCGWVMFGDVICKICCSRFPENFELVLINAIPHPVKTHINGLGTLEFDVVVGNTACGGIVYLDRGGWLGVAHFM